MNLKTISLLWLFPCLRMLKRVKKIQKTNNRKRKKNNNGLNPNESIDDGLGELPAVPIKRMHSVHNAEDMIEAVVSLSGDVIEENILTIGTCEYTCDIRYREMQLDIRNTATHLWITAFWCALGAVVLGAIAVISCWIRRCRVLREHNRLRASQRVVSESAEQREQNLEDLRQHAPQHIASESNEQREHRLEIEEQRRRYTRCRRDFEDSADHQNNPQHRHKPNKDQQEQQHQHQQQHQQQQHQSASTPRSVSILVYKTLNTVFKNSRKIIFRVCEVASAKKSLKMFNIYSSMKNREGNENESTTGHDRFCQTRVTNRNRKKRKSLPNASKQVRRTNSANEFDNNVLSAAARRQMFSRHRPASSEQDNSDHSEISEKSPLVSARLDSIAKIFFSKSIPTETGTGTDTGSKDTVESSVTRRRKRCATDSERPNIKYQYTALDNGVGVSDRSPRERAARDRALSACQEWMQKSNGRYDIIAHLDEIGSRHNKHWFLISDSTVRTDRLMSLLPIPPDCVALDELPPSESPKGLLMELLGSLHHPYVYPVLDLGFLYTESINYACLVMPFNPRGSLKDLIYKAQWNEPYNRKYTRKPSGLPLSQIQRLGRQILEALLFLKERGFPLHGHLHSGNVILQNGVARLAGLENSLMGLHSRINAVLWSRSTTDIEHIDMLCFGYLLYEMCVGDELSSPNPSISNLELELERHPQILEILALIFEPPDGCIPTVEELVLCDLFRNIDLRELRGPCVTTIKPSFSKSTLNLLQAVKKRQTASLGGSFSEASSPCTPPSTPRDRRAGKTDSFDISSDSEDALDEVVITSSSYDSHHYDPLNSPIHFCDNSLQSDDNSSSITTSAPASASAVNSSQAYEEVEPSTNISTNASLCTNNQLTAGMCNFKNSKSRRMEYSLKCMKYGKSNPSQDSAFGSLTDGELSIASSSFRLSSFQSITSPIDEGVEDMILCGTTKETNLTETGNMMNVEQNDSAVSTPCREGSPQGLGLDIVDTRKSPSVSPKKQKTSIQYNSCGNQQQLQLEPPKILVNDQNSIYTTSPSKKSSTIEVFSQKYRVSSFEDMSPNRKNLRNVNKLAFRSLEEERRIDNAFVPIKDRTNSENRVYSINKNEKYKKLTHASFTHRIIGSNSRDRYTMWKDSTLYRKTKIAKSNDSLLESLKSKPSSNSGDINELKKSLNRGNSVNEINFTSYDSREMDYLRINARKSRSERYLFNLSKLKQTAVSDCFSEDESLHDNKSLNLSSNSVNQSSSCFNNLEEGNESNADSSEEHSPLHQDICKFIGNFDDPQSSSEEKTPLLDSMEMSPISPTGSDHTL